MKPHPLVEELAGLRHRARMSQQKVADQIGYARITIAHWEIGRNTPPLAALEAYAAVFGQTVQLAPKKETP